MIYDILERRNASLDFKNEMSKIRKIEIFPKGLVHGFSQKLVIFQDFYCRENRPEECDLRYSRTKKRFSRL